MVGIIPLPNGFLGFIKYEALMPMATFQVHEPNCHSYSFDSIESIIEQSNDWKETW